MKVIIDIFRNRPIACYKIWWRKFFGLTFLEVFDKIVIQSITYYYNNMRQILNISMPLSMLKDIKKEAKEEGFATISEFIRHLFRWYHTEKLYAELKQARKEVAEGKVVKLNSLKDLR